ncbi:MAG: hypothetical protein ABR915_01125 [Thermoguttaceae bacterium]|jgi:hypothetical protein
MMLYRMFFVLAMFPTAASLIAQEIGPDLTARWKQEFNLVQEEVRVLGDKALPQEYGKTTVQVNLQSPVDVVCSRTQALLDRIAQLPGAPAMGKLQSELTALRSRAASHPADEALFLEVCALRQRIALSNPLIDFDSLLFTAYEGDSLIHLHNNAAASAKVCAGAGLYIVSGIKSGKYSVVDLLEKAPVTNGRYQGKILSNRNPEWMNKAIFNSLALSYDAKQIVFSWAQGKLPKGSKGIWNCRGGWLTPESSLHLFKVGTDGSNLQQLTDTRAANDYHPCWHPDGQRIIFISDRMLNSERCGGNSVTGNLFIMNANGENLYPISWHETSELNPSIDNNGMLVYTRWDYVDRHQTAYHNMWICYPDGRDPRAYHGNYGGRQYPMAEIFIRAIPGSQKYMALASGHHSQPQGNIVLIDLTHKDGDAGQLTTFWPGMALKSDGWPNRKTDGVLQKNHCDPWPLSEDFAIVGRNSEIVLVDRFRNEILLYDAAKVLMETNGFPVRFPTPLKARPAPPCIADRTFQGVNRPKAPPATISVVNVNESDYAWPPDTKITALRIVQILPKPAVVDGDPALSGEIDLPRIGYASQSSARMILGTVPVEPDGSAYFEAPVEREIYFQALDEKGMAVATMLSGTYVHPGEQLTCIGCHEDKSKAVATKGVRKAFQRPPSRITPDVDGSCPLTYHRLVKMPVFDKKCLPCHIKEGKGIQDFSYWKSPDDEMRKNKSKKIDCAGDIHKYVRYYELVGGRSTPKERLAYGSPLLKYLDPSHYGVALSAEEFHRVTLWLDANSLELGTFDLMKERIDKQRKGEVVWPSGPPLYEGVNYYGVDPANPTGVQRPVP